jgi:hypothetical protein
VDASSLGKKAVQHKKGKRKKEKGKIERDRMGILSKE